MECTNLMFWWKEWSVQFSIELMPISGDSSQPIKWCIQELVQNTLSRDDRIAGIWCVHFSSWMPVVLVRCLCLNQKHFVTSLINTFLAFFRESALRRCRHAFWHFVCAADCRCRHIRQLSSLIHVFLAQSSWSIMWISHYSAKFERLFQWWAVSLLFLRHNPEITAKKYPVPHHTFTVSNHPIHWEAPQFHREVKRILIWTTVIRLQTSTKSPRYSSNSTDLKVRTLSLSLFVLPQWMSFEPQPNAVGVLCCDSDSKRNGQRAPRQANKGGVVHRHRASNQSVPSFVEPVPRWQFGFVFIPQRTFHDFIWR